MPVRLIQPYMGQAANTLWWGAGQENLKSVGIADDYIERASDYAFQTRIVRTATATASVNAKAYNMDSPNAQKLTIPLSGFWPVGTILTVTQIGVAPTNIVSASGVSQIDIWTSTTNRVVTLYKYGPDAWITSGGGARVAPGYINTAVATPLAVFGAQRLVSGYNGPIIRLRRADATEQDFSCPANSDYLDYVAITSWANNTAITVVTMYDQTGNSRHFTQATAANQPSFDPSIRYGAAAPILWDGQRSVVSGPVAKFLRLAGQSISRQNVSIVDVFAPMASISDESYWQFTDPTLVNNDASAFTNTWTTNNAMGRIIRPGAAAPAPNDAAYVARAIYDVIIDTMRSTDREMLLRGQTINIAAAPVPTAASMTDLMIGRSSGDIAQSAVYTYNQRGRRLGFAVFPALSAGNAATIRDSLVTALGLQTSFDYRLVIGGDSINEGSGVLLTRNMPNQLLDQLTKRAELFNMAVHGQTMATEYSNRVLRFSGLYAGASPSIVILEASTNDLISGTSGANLYTNSTAPMITYLKGLGYKVIVTTTLPRTGAAGWTGAMETQRQAYIPLVLANSAGADYVLDLASHPIMGPTSACADTSLYIDCTHPTALGDAYLAGAPSGGYANQFTYYYALQQVLRTATGDPGYVP